MVDGFFFCATLTVRRGGHTPFVQAGVETSDTGTEGFKPDTLSVFGRFVLFAKFVSLQHICECKMTC